MREFPGRPEHPDFWLLAQSVQDLDAQADSGQAAPDIITRYLDLESVRYMAVQRALRVMRGQKTADPPQIAGAWIDGLITGMAVQHLKTRGTEEGG